MRIWYFHNTTMLPEHGTLNRGYYLGKYLKKLGHEPIIFAGSHPHNTNLQLIKNKKPFKVYQNTPFPWILIRTRNYSGSRNQQIISMFEYYFNAQKAVKKMNRPDVIIGSSSHPLAALLAIRLAKKYNCKGVVEIRDLWPESIVVYGILPKNHLIVKMMYKFERYLYKKADAIIFTQEGAYKYIEDKHWEDDVPRSKVYFVNNGTDLEEFKKNATTYVYKDKDLDNNDTFKVVYTGAIKLVNNVGSLLNIAKQIKNDKVRFLIYGDGDELASLKKRVEEEVINNVSFKGKVDKKYIPSILIRCNLCIMHVAKTGVLKYGISPNKLFDYFAAGKPVLTDNIIVMNPVIKYKAGIECDAEKPETVVAAIDNFASMSKEKYDEFCRNAYIAAKEYSYEYLAQKLVDALK